METNQDRWNKVRSVEKELEELERDIENVSFRQLAELKRMCRRGYKIFSNQQEKKKKGEDLENIKSLDPLLYSKLTHQKNIRIK